MKRTKILAELLSNPGLMARWKELVDSGDMHDILRVCQCFKYPYTEDAREDPHPHIQSERNGGIKAWGKLEYNLITLPNRQEEMEMIADDRSPPENDRETAHNAHVRDSDLPKPSHQRFVRKFSRGDTANDN